MGIFLVFMAVKFGCVVWSFFCILFNPIHRFIDAEENNDQFAPYPPENIAEREHEQTDKTACIFHAHSEKQV